MKIGYVVDCPLEKNMVVVEEGEETEADGIQVQLSTSSHSSSDLEFLEQTEQCVIS